MIVLERKRIVFVLLVFTLTIFTYHISLKVNNSKDTLQTVSLPVTNKVVIIDAGHGLPDGGAVGENGVTEEEINLKIAMKIQTLLEQSGSTVIITRSDEKGISDMSANTIREKHRSDLKNRVKIGNESSADIFVSIHLNKIPQENYSGWQAFYKNNDESSKKLANNIQKKLNETIQKENNREISKISGIYIVDNIEIPITIVECGFLSNTEERNKLQEDEYQNKLAWGIYTGIIEHFYE